MGRVGVDLTGVGLVPDGVHTCTVSKLDYQISTALKTDGSDKPAWGKGCVDVVDFDTWASVPQEKRRLHYTIAVPGKAPFFQDFYMMESALGFIQAFLKACGVGYSKEGFDPDEAIGKMVTAEASITEDPIYGESNNFKFSKV